MSTTVHPTILGSRLVVWPDEAACHGTAGLLAARPALREATLELHGPLGAGKTTFVRHLLRALGVQGPVKSPTYAVMEPYSLPAPSPSIANSAAAEAGTAWHFDFFRFDDPHEWEDAGFRDIYAGRGLKVAEWPEKAAGLLPAPDLRIDIAPADVGGHDAGHGHGSGSDDAADAAVPLPRRVRFEALTPRGLELLP